MDVTAPVWQMRHAFKYRYMRGPQGDSQMLGAKCRNMQLSETSSSALQNLDQSTWLNETPLYGCIDNTVEGMLSLSAWVADHPLRL